MRVKRNKVGKRPNEYEVRDRSLTILLSKRELEAITGEATRQGISRNELVRQSLVKVIGERKAL